MIRTTTRGIFQSDLLIRTAVMTAIEELRQNPWLLDFVFAWLPNDSLSKSDYGDREVQDAKDWFLNTDISVTMAYRHDRPQLPCIGIELLDSNEGGANSLADVHYDSSEYVNADEIIIRPKPALGPFTPKSYDSATGIVTLPDNVWTRNVFEGNILYDAVANKGYPIRSILSDTAFAIDKGVRANFTRAFVAPRESLQIAKLESVEFQETYRLRCYVNTTAVHLTYLHSILTFVLLRSKEALLESRGFERTVLRSQGIALNGSPEEPEKIYYRDIVISGFVRQYWPKTITPTIDGIIVESIRVIDGGKSPDGIAKQVEEQGWMMEKDHFGWK